jgi:hypothetical protein
MHTAQIVRPAAVPWAVVSAHVSPRVVDDAYLLTVKLAWAVKRLTGGPSLAKLESRYSPRMADPPPALEPPPVVEFEAGSFFSVASEKAPHAKKARELEVHLKASAIPVNTFCK